jgi:hypothetical chaperone protein
LTRLVLGRPVFFVDDDPKRDSQAQSALAQAAHNVGFADVRFQFEPIAAALDYESTVNREQIVLVADIGGGTSDFSLVRVGPRQRQRVERKDDILANHGVHIAGTDFDRQLGLRSILPHCGFQALGPRGREVPSKVYFDLATWHLINTVYSPGRVAELKQMASFYVDSKHHARLMAVVRQRLGHALIAKAEAAKIAVAEIAELAEVAQSAKPAHANAHPNTAIDKAKPQPRPAHTIDLGVLEPGLQALVNENDLLAALGNDMDRIAAAAGQTLIQAGLARDKVNALYFTGGSTGLAALAARIAAQFPAAKIMRGDRFASVATGLGIHAQRVFA